MRRLRRLMTIGFAAPLFALAVTAPTASAQQAEFSVDHGATITGNGSGLRVTGTYACPGSERAEIVIYVDLTRTRTTVPCTEGHPASWWVIAAPAFDSWHPGEAGFHATLTDLATGQTSAEDGALTIS